jgi:hypothetical protein
MTGEVTKEVRTEDYEGTEWPAHLPTRQAPQGAFRVGGAFGG